MEDNKDLDMEGYIEESVEEATGEASEVKIPEAPKNKAEQIKKSNMPKDEKEKYLRQLGLQGDSGEKQEGKLIPFSVYAQIRKIKPELQGAMKVYPKAKDLNAASLKEWDEIFKKF